MRLAEAFGGEIICADSRTIYKGMDIGTAKPSANDRQQTVHHGLDLVHPNEHFSAAEFQRYTKEKVREIASRGKVPFIVGGTGLYIDGFVYNFSFAPKPSDSERKRLDSMGLEQLQVEARNLGVDSDQVNYANPRHLARAIERSGVKPARQAKPDNILYLAISIDWEVLKKRLEERVEAMFAEGLLDEAQGLFEQYEADSPGLLAPGYKALNAFFADSSISLDEVKKQFVRNDIHLAKRQKTWFARNPDIVWCESEDQIMEQVAAFLSKFDTITA
jgi:tRNA dimethylallyltransferase